MSESTPAGAAHAPAISFARETPASTSAETLPGHRNPAVKRCQHEFERTFREEMRSGHSKFESRETAKLAFRCALPDLIGIDNIRDFIACLSAGLAVGILDHRDATRLLYAAQIAIAAAPREIRPAGRPKREPVNQSPQQATVPDTAVAQSPPTSAC
jgi:hypothetical protein